MSCEHLICAQCGGPVAEARCSVCRVTRDHTHHNGHGPSLPVVAALVLVALLLTLAAMHLGH
jgi:hypothetical protein